MRRFSFLLALALGCTGNGEITPGADASISVGDGGGADAPLPGDDAGGGGGIADGGPLLNDAGQTLCNVGGTLAPCQCSDGVNNDSDELIDSADPECTGPFDNDESSYATGIPGDNQDPFKQDCFFDGDSGSGNDGCLWDIRCTDPPDGQHCQNNTTVGCESCRGITPNGCDCFGCCTIFVDGVEKGPVRIIDTCTVDNIDDPQACPPCEKVEQCENPCEPCEICVGKPEPDPGCGGDAGPGMQCPVGINPCTPPDNTCPAEFRCITGCCVRYLSKQ